jgi:hypothetical protein
MNKLLLTLILTFGLSSIVYAQSHVEKQHSIKPISEKRIQKMDHRLTKHKALKRTFKNKQEFQHKKRNIHMKTSMMKHNGKHVISGKMHKKIAYNNNYDNGYNYNATSYKDDYRPIRQRGHRYSKQGWILAYRYDRAVFYDNEGFYYGYFNRHGYYFEDVFYRYDRYYTYRDRVRGRGLFDRQYYMPANANYYGFCESRANHRAYDRGYNRY